MDARRGVIADALSLCAWSVFSASASRLRFIGNSLVQTGLQGYGRGGALFCYSKDVELNRVYAARNTLFSLGTSGVVVFIDNSFVKITSSILEHNVGIGVSAW
jgi:hypothetical protein